MNILELLYDALYSEHGLAVETNNVKLLRQRLYARRKKEDPTFSSLSFSPDPSSPERILFIIKKGSK